MKKYLFILSLFLFLLPQKSMASGIDSLSFTSQFIGVGETWYTDYFTGCSVYTNRSFFKDESGGLHMVFISNYQLFYYASFDGGQTWSEEQIITGFEGDIKQAIIWVDADGNPFIAITTNPYFNYGNPTGISYGQEFHINTYFIYKEVESWLIEDVYLSEADNGWSYNYGMLASELYKEGDEFVIVGARYGWYDYGGEIWEVKRNSEGTWSDPNVILDYNDTNVDHSVVHVYSILYDDGSKDLVYDRPYNSSGIAELATIHFDGENWSAATQLTTDLYNYVAWDLTTGGNGQMWLSYFSNEPEPHVVLYNSLDSPVELAIDLSLVDTIQSLKIHYTADDLLNLIIYPYMNDTAVLYVSEDLGLTWSEPFYEDRAMLTGVLPVSDQYSTQLADFDFMHISRVSNVEPYGPDSLFYHHIDLFNTTYLGIDQYEMIRDKMTIYPNPVLDEVRISYLSNISKDMELRIMDLHGKVMLERDCKGSEGETIFTLDVSNLKAGVYIIEMYEIGYPPDEFHRTKTKMLKISN
jgi:hypothetical protein